MSLRFLFWLGLAYAFVCGVFVLAFAVVTASEALIRRLVRGATERPLPGENTFKW